MKSFVLLLLVAFVAWGDAKVSHVPSYLRHVGTYKFNTTDTGKFTVKQYYLSQRVMYSWSQSYVICKSVGMRMATIESKSERDNLKNIVAAHPKLFLEEFYIDGHNLTANQKPSFCISMERVMRGQLKANEIGCDHSDKKFMCEDVDVVDVYVETAEVPTKLNLDIRNTFFSYLGSHEDGTVKKSYYYENILYASPEHANQICQAFDMILAAPQSQSEFDRLKRLLLAAEYIPWGRASIAGYRSEEKTKEWYDSSQLINYAIDWNDGEPNNSGGKENCLALTNKNGKPKMNDFPCNTNADFICEFDHSKPSVKVTADDANFSKFMKPLTHYKIGENTKHLFLSELHSNWVESKLTCQVFGMELFMHESEAEEAIMSEEIGKIVNFYETVNIGATTVGDSFPYNVNTGKVIDYELKRDTDFPLNRCLQLKKRSIKNDVYYYYTQCFNSASKFICQQVKPWVPADDVTTTQKPERKGTTTAYEDYEAFEN